MLTHLRAGGRMNRAHLHRHTCPRHPHTVGKGGVEVRGRLTPILARHRPVTVMESRTTQDLETIQGEMQGTPWEASSKSVGHSPKSDRVETGSRDEAANELL